MDRLALFVIQDPFASAVGQRRCSNGASGKTGLTEDGPVRIEVPRDRQGSFAPLLIPKHERRFTGFDEKIDRRRRGDHVRASFVTPAPPSPR